MKPLGEPDDREPEPDDDGIFAFDLDPTVGHCSKCGEARSEFYTCRDGGSTVPVASRDSQAQEEPS